VRESRPLELIGHGETREQDVDGVVVTDVRQVWHVRQRQGEGGVISGGAGQKKFRWLKTSSHIARGARCDLVGGPPGIGGGLPGRNVRVPKEEGPAPNCW